MPRFIAVHTLPHTEQDFLNTARDSAEKLAQLPPGVTYNVTYCGFNDHKFFCDWEAPDKGTLEQIFKAMEMPFDAIYPVRKFVVAKGAFED
jgi:hypothetical protein